MDNENQAPKPRRIFRKVPGILKSSLSEDSPSEEHKIIVRGEDETRTSFNGKRFFDQIAQNEHRVDPENSISVNDPDHPYNFLQAKNRQGMWEAEKEPLLDIYYHFKEYISKNESSDEWADPTASEWFMTNYGGLDPKSRLVVRAYASYLWTLHSKRPTSAALEIADSTSNLPPSPVEPQPADDPAAELQETKYIPIDDKENHEAELLEPFLHSSASQAQTETAEQDDSVDKDKPNENVGYYVVLIDKNVAELGSIPDETVDLIIKSNLPSEEKMFLFERIIKLLAEQIDKGQGATE